MRVAPWLFLTFLALYALTAGGHFYASDDVQKLAVLDALWQHGGFAIPDGWVHGADGRRYAWFPLGTSLLMLPGWLLGQLAALALPTLPPQLAPRFFVSLENTVFSAALVALVYRMARGVGARTGQAAFAAIAFGAGTMAWPYAKTAWSEPAAALALYAGLWALARAAGPTQGTEAAASLPADRPAAGQPTPSLALAGLGLAAACALRQEWLLAAAGAAAWWAWRQRHAPRQAVAQLAWLLAPLAALEAASLAYDAMRYGSAWGFPAYTLPQRQKEVVAPGRLAFALRNLYQYTFSPNQGLPWYSPAALAGLLGLASLPPAARRLAGLHAAALAPLALFYVVGWGSSSWAWGLRYGYVFLPALLLPAAWLWRPGRRPLAGALLALGVAVQLIAILPDPVDLYERELARYPGLTIRQLVLEPAHAPLVLATRAAPGLLAQGAHALVAGPPTSDSPRAVRGELPDVWWVLALLWPVPRGAIFGALALLVATLGVSVRGLCRALARVSRSADNPPPPA